MIDKKLNFRVSSISFRILVILVILVENVEQDFQPNQIRRSTSEFTSYPVSSGHCGHETVRDCGVDELDHARVIHVE